MNMSVFRFRLYRKNEQVLTNWINAESREDAMNKLEDLKKEMNADEIHLNEVYGATWKC